VNQNPWEWASAGSIVATVIGIVALAVKAGPEWIKAKAQRENLDIDTSAKVQGMTLEYAERVRDELKEALAMVEKLTAALQAANEENEMYRRGVETLPASYRARFSIVPPGA